MDRVTIMSFKIESFVAACQTALKSSDPMGEVQSLVADAIADPEAISAVLPPQAGEPSRILHRDDDLTVLQVSLPPGLKSPVHNHTIWAVICIYEGQEDNRFFTSDEELTQRSERSLITSKAGRASGGWWRSAHPGRRRRRCSPRATRWPPSGAR